MQAWRRNDVSEDAAGAGKHLSAEAQRDQAEGGQRCAAFHLLCRLKTSEQNSKADLLIIKLRWRWGGGGVQECCLFKRTHVLPADGCIFDSAVERQRPELTLDCCLAAPFAPPQSVTPPPNEVWPRDLLLWVALWRTSRISTRPLRPSGRGLIVTSWCFSSFSKMMTITRQLG